jgi:DNA-binding NarL/FixJ family response regulator
MLTPRQQEIARYVARGYTNKRIAGLTHISVKTVNKHIEDAARRLPGVERARHKLTVYALDMDRAA